MIRLTIWYENVQEKGILDKNIFQESFAEEEEKKIRGISGKDSRRNEKSIS